MKLNNKYLCLMSMLSLLLFSFPFFSEINAEEYTFIDFDSQTNCIDWAHRKIEALNNPKFGTQLRESIASSPMTVDAISKVANCSRFAIHKWMRSESYPPIHTTKRIAKAISPMGWPMLFDSWCEQIELEQ